MKTPHHAKQHRSKTGHEAILKGAVVLLLLGLLTSPSYAQDGGSGTDGSDQLVQHLNAFQQLFGNGLARFDERIPAGSDCGTDGTGHEAFQRSLDQAVQRLDRRPDADSLATLRTLTKEVQRANRNVITSIQAVREQCTSAHSDYQQQRETLNRSMNSIATLTREAESTLRITRASIDEIIEALNTSRQTLDQLNEANEAVQAAQAAQEREWQTLLARRKDAIRQAQADKATQITADIDTVAEEVTSVLDRDFAETVEPDDFEEQLLQMLTMHQSLVREFQIMSQIVLHAHAFAAAFIQNNR